MTNNPDKGGRAGAAGIAVVERVSAEVEPQESFAGYLKTKQEKMGHINRRFGAFFDCDLRMNDSANYQSIWPGINSAMRSS
jgi:hypothetical protein